MARKDRENLEQLMASNPKLQEQLEERIAAAVAEARAAWEAEQEAPEEEVAEPSEPEEARRLAEEREALEEEILKLYGTWEKLSAELEEAKG